MYHFGVLQVLLQYQKICLSERFLSNKENTMPAFKKNSLFFVLFVTVFFFSMTVFGNPQQEKQKKNGFGLSIGALFFSPSEVNDFSKDLWEELQSGYIITGKVGNSNMFAAYPFKLRGLFSPANWISLEPYGEILWGPKLLMLQGASNDSVLLSVLAYSAGVNLWFGLPSPRRMNFKLGAGGFFAYSTLSVSGDLGKASLSGTGFGGNLLAGLDLNLRKIIITVDGIIPIGSVKYSIDRDNLDSYVDARFPSKLGLTGFSIRPGIIFKF
jgi:hypothetical protein